MMDLTPEAAAILILAACVLLAGGCLLLALRGLIEAVHGAGAELNGLEGSVENVRRVLDDRLYRVSVNIDAHASAVRDSAAEAPEALVAQRNELAVDVEKLSGALTAIVEYRPDPEAGTYTAGANAVLAHAREQLKAAL